MHRDAIGAQRSDEGVVLPRALHNGRHGHGVSAPGKAPGEEADDALKPTLLPGSDEMEDRQAPGH